jgi:hypothetical protein
MKSVGDEHGRDHLRAYSPAADLPAAVAGAAAGKPGCARTLPPPRRLAPTRGLVRQAAQNACGDARIQNARTEVDVMNRSARFPAARRGRPGLRGRGPAGQRLPAGHGGEAERVAAAYARPSARRSRKVTGAIQPRVFRPCVRVAATSLGQFEPAADDATSEHLDAREPTAYERRSLSRPQRPPPPACSASPPHISPFR